MSSRAFPTTRLVREALRLEKGKPPAQQPYYGADAELYLTPEYLRGGSASDPVKPSRNAVRAVDGDTIVLWDGSNAGEILLGREGVLASTMCLVRTSSDINRDYIYHALKRWEHYLKGQTSGSGIPHVDKELFGRLELAAFHEDEQSKIAEVLSTIDRAIERTEVLIAKQQRIKTGLMQDLLTRGIDEHGNLRSERTHQFKDSALGRIPQEWVVATLLDATERTRQPVLTGPFGADLGDSDFVVEGVPVLRIGNVQRGSLDLSDLLFVSAEKARELSRYVIRTGDLLFARQGATTGRNALVNERADGCLINYHIIRVALDHKLCAPRFIEASFDSESVKRQVDREKGRGTREGINTAQLKALQLKLPSVAEQRAIAFVLGAQDKQSAQTRQLKVKLLRLRAGLMQDLLTGRKPVTTLLAASEEAGRLVS